MTINLDTLRKTAEAATPGPWEIDGPVNPGPDDTLALHNNDGGAIAYVQPLWDDAEFIATFDPPTVLALLSRLEQAEQAVAMVREVAESSDDKHLTMAILEALDGGTRRLADAALGGDNNG